MNGENDVTRTAKLNALASDILRGFAFKKLNYPDGLDILSACVATLVFNVQIEEGNYGKDKDVGTLEADKMRSMFMMRLDDMIAQLRCGTATIEKDKEPLADKPRRSWGRPPEGEEWRDDR